MTEVNRIKRCKTVGCKLSSVSSRTTTHNTYKNNSQCQYPRITATPSQPVKAVNDAFCQHTTKPTTDCLRTNILGQLIYLYTFKTR